MARSTPPSLTKGLEYFDNDVRHCFALSTAVYTTNSARKEALVTQRLSEHSSACYIASLSMVGMWSESNQNLLNSINKFNEHASNYETVTLEAIRETPCHQKVLSSKLEDSLFAQLFYHCLTELAFYLFHLPMLQHGFLQLLLLVLERSEFQEALVSQAPRVPHVPTVQLILWALWATML